MTTMANRDIKFIAADMDGTLLDENSNLDPAFFDVFAQLEKRNIIFAAASGRQYYSLLETFSPVKERMMFVAENGTLVMYKGEELYSNTMEKSSTDAVIRAARNIPGSHVVLCGKKSTYIETESQQAIDEISKYYHNCQSVEDLLAVEDEFIKVALCHFDGAEELMYPGINQEFGHDHKVVVSARVWLDVMSHDASKGAAIKHLQNSLGFTFEQTMSFGDYFNDLEMLQESYHSYAMANAHEGVKKYARFAAPSNRESGVLKVINQLLSETE